MICTYTRRLWIMRVVAQDGVLVAALAVAASMGGAMGSVLALGIGASLVWAFFTLHFPSKVEVTDDAIAFSAYGRVHVFPWREVTRVRVRRFLVRDRVLVRLAPASTWRGRYWLTDGLSGYDALLRELERRAGSTAAC